MNTTYGNWQPGDVTDEMIEEFVAATERARRESGDRDGAPSAEDFRHGIAAAMRSTPGCSEAVVVVPCDSETYPRAFNDGFDAALEQVIEELTEGQYCDPDDDALHAAILRDYGMHLRQMVDQAHESAGRKPGRSDAETEWGVRVEHEGGVIQSPLDFDVPNTFESAQKACDEANALGANAVPIRREVGPWTAAGYTTGRAGDDA